MDNMLLCSFYTSPLTLTDKTLIIGEPTITNKDKLHGVNSPDRDHSWTAAEIYENQKVKFMIVTLVFILWD